MLLHRKCLQVLVTCIGVSAAPTAASALNIVGNGTFDDRTVWTNTTGAFIVRNGPTGGFPSLDTGTYYHGGNTAFSEIEQTVALTAQQLLELATVGLDFTMSADLFGFGNQGDFSTFTADFRDGGDTSLGTVTLSSVDGDPGAWPINLIAGTAPSFQTINGALPGATEAIVFTVSSTRLSGSSNDGYLDNASFGLVSAQVPIPAALPLLGSVIVLGSMTGRLRRSNPCA